MRRVRTFFKRLGRGMVHFLTHWSVKKGILTVLVAALCMGAGSFVAKKLSGGAMDAMARASTRTTVLKRSALTESVTVTGTVKSAGVANVTSAATAKVMQILVKEGDSVTTGQTLCLLDTTELDRQIAKAKSGLGDAVKTAQKALVDAQKNYSDAVAAQTEALDKATAQENTLASAKSALDAAAAVFNTAKGSVAAMQSAYQNAYAADENAGRALNGTDYLARQAAYTAAQANTLAATANEAAAKTVLDNASASDPNLSLYKAAWDSAVLATAAAKTAEKDAKTAMDVSAATYQAAVTNKETTAAALSAATAALNTAKQNCNYAVAENAYNTANGANGVARQTLDALEGTYKAAAKSTDAAKRAIETAQDGCKKAATSDALETLQRQRDECTITATANGTITAVNATVGSLPGGAAASALFVIQDTDHLKVAVVIDEYDIKKIKTGMEVVILSDATGDTEIRGTVSQISQTASKTAESSGFGAEITVDSNGSGLLIGMSAKAKIILSRKDGVYSVPYDAIGKNEKGESIVFVKQSNGTFEPVPVTTGTETDYFVEISGGALSEGMEVRNSADESSLDRTDSGGVPPDAVMGGEVTMAAAPMGEPEGRG
ncbi:MAG: HlyD family efflux transporter periplasmic adaptor subunit [Ruthenibacterium sp.]